MIPTNYYLFDFLDFDPSLRREESLWKAYPPVAVYERAGDVCLDVPFQRQQLSNDMAADTSAPQEIYTLVLRAYSPNVFVKPNEQNDARINSAMARKGGMKSMIMRVFMSMEPTGRATEATLPTEKDDMLQFSASVERQTLHVEKVDEGWRITDADNLLRAFVRTAPFPTDHWSDLLPAPQPTLDLRLYPDEKKEVALAAYDHFSPPRYDALPLAFVKRATGCRSDGALSALLAERTSSSVQFATAATLSFACSADECFVGTGERFMKLDLSGQTFFLKNQDGQGVNNRRTYKNIPFYLSSRGYGVFYHTSAYSKLSLAGQSTRSVQFLAEEPMIDAFVIGGDTPEEILRGYRHLTGFPQMPPTWSFGIWMSRMTYFSADEVTAICDRLRREHYPCDVIHLDTGWFRTDWLCEWKFNEERFPDPAAFISNLKAKGFRVSLWQLPYVAEDAEQIVEAKENDYIAPLTHRQATDGSNFSALDYAGTIDFTYDRATEWYKSLLRNLLQMGVACIKTDFGENIHMDASYKNMSAERLNNLYALLYQRAAYEVTKEVTGEGIVWARAAWAGCQRYPLHWGGDACSSWDGMAATLRGGLHLGLSGFAFWSHDVPGFHTLPDFMNGIVNDELYVRWTQFGVFTSHMRYHGTNKREPWHYPAVADIVKRWWRLRYALIPYILQESRIACKTGFPLVRALVFHHPDDKTCWHIDDEYYFGRDFLVSPVMNSDGHRDVYLPEGTWKDFFTGQLFNGPVWLHLRDIPLERMPVYVRYGAWIPFYPHPVDCTDEMDLSSPHLGVTECGLSVDDNFKGFTL